MKHHICEGTRFLKIALKTVKQYRIRGKGREE
jgi:hypothetical protein